MNAYAIMKSGKPFSDYEFLVNLDKAKGVDIGNTYLNRKQGLEFGIVIATTIRNKISIEFSQANFFNAIVDECTDVYRMEQVILYVRYSIRGKVCYRFVSIDNVIRANAEQLFEMILKMFKSAFNWHPPDVPLTDSPFDPDVLVYTTSEDNEPEVEEVTDSVSTDGECNDDSDDAISLEEEQEFEEDVEVEQNQVNTLMIGMTSDGANVLRGKKNGVHTKIKAVANQLLVSSHCISHRFQLSSKSVMEKQNTRLKELILYLQKLFN